MHKVTQARNQISPLLDQLITELDADGAATQKAYFNRVRGHLSGATDELELTATIVELSSCTAMGFKLSNTADAILARILEKVSTLIDVLEGETPSIH